MRAEAPARPVAARPVAARPVAARASLPSAGALLDGLGIDSPHQIDVDAIAQHCGATVVYEPLRGCAARILANGDRAIITVDSRAHPVRQRFSAAHELGHWMLDRGTTAFACTARTFGNEWSAESPEVRANRWAAELLMPERLFSKDAVERPTTFDTARDLARRYRTSLLATALRMVQCNRAYSRINRPTMIIRSRLGRRWRWFVRSPLMPQAAWPLDEPGPGSLAYRLLRGQASSGWDVVKQKEWLRLENPLLYYVDEDSMRLRDGDVLTLLEWTDEVALVELASENPGCGLVGDRG